MRLALVAADPASQQCLLEPAWAELGRRGHRLVFVGGREGAAAASATPGHAADRLLCAPGNWSWRSNAGGRSSLADGADTLVFLTGPLPAVPEQLLQAARRLERVGADWGIFSLAPPRAPGLRGHGLRGIFGLDRLGTRVTGVAGPGDALLLRAASFAALGGFDLAASQAATELCRRARLLGRPLVAAAVPCAGPATGCAPAPSPPAWRALGQALARLRRHFTGPPGGG
jgi:hypothetical protein